MNGMESNDAIDVRIREDNGKARKLEERNCQSCGPCGFTLGFSCRHLVVYNLPGKETERGAVASAPGMETLLNLFLDFI